MLACHFNSLITNTYMYVSLLKTSDDAQAYVIKDYT